MRNLEEFNGKYEGKVAFVIASGPSIYFQDLEPLKNFVTIAVNSGYVALPESDFFVSDDQSVVNWDYFYSTLKNSSHTIPLLYEDKLKSSVSLFGDRIVLYRHRRRYHITNFYEHENYSNHLVQCHSSVGTAIHVAHVMGFSKIGLLGVDCRRFQGCRYFWQIKDKKVFKEPKRKDGIPIDPFHRVNLRGVQTDTDLNSIMEYWQKQGDKINEKCDVYNLSSLSILDVFPKISLNQFLEDNQNGRKNR